MSEIITVGLDLAKSVFQVHGADGSGQAVLARSCDAITCWRCSASSGRAS